MKRLFLLALFATAPAFGQWFDGTTAVADEPWRKTQGQFGAMLILTDAPEALMEAWNAPETPRIATTSVATRDKPIVAFLLFTGCAEAQGRCDADVDFVVLKPDGSEYASHAGAPLWKSAAPPGRALQLGMAHLGIRIEPHDPVGRYRVLAKARDVNAKVAVELVQTFIVER